MQPRPAFFVVCGDLVDAFGEKFPEIRARQEADLKKVYSKLDPAIPMVCVCGNHDVGNSPTPETIARYKESFGDDYFSFYKNGVAFLVLNSQFYADSTHVVSEYKAHETWLERELRKAQEVGASHVVIFQHIPWFISDWGEDKQYFNLEKDLRVAKLDQFHKAGVKKVFCGHYHRNAGGMYKDLEVVVTTAIGCQIPHPDTNLRDEHGMRVVKVTKEEITHSFHPLHSFPTRIDV